MARRRAEIGDNRCQENNDDAKIFALVPAAGQGTRMGDALPKQYLPVAGRPMMFHSLEALAAVGRIDCVIAIPLAARPALGRPRLERVPRQDRGALRGRRNARQSVATPCPCSAAGGGRRLDPRPRRGAPLHRHEARRAVPGRGRRRPGGRAPRHAARGHAQARRGIDARGRDDPARGPVARADAANVPPRPPAGAASRESPTRPTSRRRSSSLGQMPRIVAGENANLKVTFAEDLPLAEMILARQAGLAP